MLLKLASLLALAASAVCTPTPTRTYSINPAVSELNGVPSLGLSQLERRTLTNSKRLAMSLPLLPPKRRDPSRRYVSASASPSPSATPAAIATGYISVQNLTSGTSIGFIRSTLNSFGEYGLTQAQDQRLQVTFDGDEQQPHDLRTINGVAAFPLVGAIQGHGSVDADLKPESSNYQYLGGTLQTPPNAPPTSIPNSYTAITGIPETCESAIFMYDAHTRNVTLQYVNTDGSRPTTFVGYAPKDDVLILTGDKTAYVNAFGPAQWVGLTFVPA